ncbi:MAG: DnaB-like helicase C-terminal domain-containing protein, partial [Chloroflexota bacterium]
SLNPIQMRTKCQRIKHEHGLDLVVLDYMQLMHARGFQNNRVAEVGHIARSLKEVARDLRVPVVALAQLNRELEKRKDKRPKLSDLKESGAIEQDSDMVIFLYRDIMYNEDAEYPNLAEAIIGKNRNGGTDTIDVYFDAPSMRYTDGVRSRVILNPEGI